MSSLRNPETRWERAGGVPAFDPEVVATRLGACPAGASLLGGGLANLNVRVGVDRVLRVYQRDPGVLAKEVALLGRDWRSFRVPQVLDVGDDWVLLELVQHQALEDGPKAGRDCGRALAELHGALVLEAFGFLDDGLRVAEGVADVGVALREHVVETLEGSAGAVLGELAEPVTAWFLRQAGVLTHLAGAPGLRHGDFKTSNLKRASCGSPLVFDWEFAWSGPALMDLGQLLRRGVDDGFREVFARAYVAGGGVLPGGWEVWAGAFDAVNLVGLLEGVPAGSPQAEDVRGRLRRWLGRAG